MSKKATNKAGAAIAAVDLPEAAPAADGFEFEFEFVDALPTRQRDSAMRNWLNGLRAHKGRTARYPKIGYPSLVSLINNGDKSNGPAGEFFATARKTTREVPADENGTHDIFVTYLGEEGIAAAAAEAAKANK